MTLLMRDQENIERGFQQGIQQGRTEGRELGRTEGRELGKINMIQNALESTRSIKQTSFILKIDEEQVRKIAKNMSITIND